MVSGVLSAVHVRSRANGRIAVSPSACCEERHVCRVVACVAIVLLPPPPPQKRRVTAGWLAGVAKRMKALLSALTL